MHVLDEATRMIIVYTLPDSCPHCKALVAKLNARCISFQERNLMEFVESGELRADCILQTGYAPMTAPVVCDNGRWVYGKEIEGWLK